MTPGRTLCCAFVTVLCSLTAVTTAEAVKRPTVAGELERLAAEGTLSPENARADRALYDGARAQLKTLTGTRRAELGGVVTDLEDMAARDRFAPTRIPALFLTLRRNVEWWTAQPLLSAGRRVGFADSQLVFQYYPGHGIQIQWLGTFGRLNGYWTGGRRYDARAGALLDEASALATERAGGLAWEYLFPFDGQQPPWVSSLAQGTGLQALARSATRLGRRPDIFPLALRGLGIFQTPPPAGVRVPDGSGAHYLQYSGLPDLLVLNGFIQSLVGLFDFAALTGDGTARALFDAGDLAARAEVPKFDTGAWSLYSRGATKVESDLGYHTLLRDFLVGLCSRTAAVQYCSAGRHFTIYLKIPPVVEVIPRTLRAHRPGSLRLKLSKISRVSVRVTRGTDAVMSRDAGILGRGTRSLPWLAPRRPGTYGVTVTATDLAGNQATAAGEVEVTKGG